MKSPEKNLILKTQKHKRKNLNYILEKSYGHVGRLKFLPYRTSQDTKLFPKSFSKSWKENFYSEEMELLKDVIFQNDVLESD